GAQSVPTRDHSLRDCESISTKIGAAIASYFHRYAMTALATQGEKGFVPSLLEAPGEFVLHDKKNARASVATTPSYSIDTIRKLKATLRKTDRLFFLIRIDAFKDIAKWHQPD